MAVRAEDQASQINRQKPARTSRLGAAEQGASSGKRQNGVQPGGRFDTIDQGEQQIAAEDAQSAPARGLPGQLRGDMRSSQRRRCQQQTDQQHRQQYRGWIIEAGFELEGPGDTRPQLKTAQMQKRRDGGRVGRRNDGTDENPRIQEVEKSRTATAPTIAAVAITPTVARATDGHSARWMAPGSVRNPPSNKIIARLTLPIR